jgi:hypothetical protein
MMMMMTILAAIELTSHLYQDTSIYSQYFSDLFEKINETKNSSLSYLIDANGIASQTRNEGTRNTID